MKCRQALDVAAGMSNRGAGWPPILGTYANGTTVRVERAERRDGDTYWVPFLVTIIAPDGESLTRYCASGAVMQKWLRTCRLQQSRATWRVLRAEAVAPVVGTERRTR